MLHFSIDPHDDAPAYRQLMAQVRYYVASGALGAGEQLPSIRALASYLGVNPSTVVQAFSELEHAAVIERHQGRGVFVAPRAKGPTARERARVLHKRARALAALAKQMGAPRKQVLEIMAEELDALDPGVRRKPK
jgi:GntR family transcriptional regulator